MGLNYKREENGVYAGKLKTSACLPLNRGACSKTNKENGVCPPGNKLNSVFVVLGGQDMLRHEL